MPERLGRHGLRAVRRSPVRAGTGRLGACVESGADLQAQSRQPVQGVGPGDVDADAMRDLLVEHRPASWPLVFAVDASTWARCEAERSEEHTSELQSRQ